MKVKVSAVSYLNTKPLLYGIFKTQFDKEIDLQLDIPSICADKLQSGEVDMGLVPVAIIPQLKNPQIVSDYCIGSTDKVQTVCIFSHCPIEELTHIYLDYHSRTSVELAKILMREYWKVDPIILKAEPGFENKIEFTRGALIIGDRAIGLDKKYNYVYDLGEIWRNHTGLPFVFAAWVSNKTLPEKFIEKLNQALKVGIESIPELMYIIPPPSNDFDLKYYYQNNISYILDKEKNKALDLFLSKVMSYQNQKISLLA